MATLVTFIYFFLGPYFIPVLIAFFIVKRFGREFHESALLPLAIPYLAYWIMLSHEDRQGWNLGPPLWIAGLAVALCMPARLAPWARPWPWAVVTTLIGVAGAYYGYVTTPPTTI
jgi:hypothetical protein